MSRARRLAVLPPYIVLGVVGAWEFEWWGVAAFVFALLVGLVILLWGECVQLEQRENELLAQADASAEELEAAADRALDAETHVVELQSANRRLEAERDAPSLTLPHLLHAVDGQLDTVAVVKKHRSMSASGHSEWPVISLNVANQDVLRIVAHGQPGDGQVLGEPLVLVQRSSDAGVAFGPAQSFGEQTLGFDADFFDLIEGFQEDLLHRAIGPQDFVLRLAGLHVQPYRDFTDAELDELAEALRRSADTVARSLTLPRGDSIQELEAPDG